MFDSIGQAVLRMLLLAGLVTLTTITVLEKDYSILAGTLIYLLERTRKGG